jgi:hypothetical protein
MEQCRQAPLTGRLLLVAHGEAARHTPQTASARLRDAFAKLSGLQQRGRQHDQHQLASILARILCRLGRGGNHHRYLRLVRHPAHGRASLQLWGVAVKPKTEIIILHETVLQSWLIDASTFVMFLALISIGVFLDSSAMQWIGAIIGFFTIVGRASRKRLSFDEARKRIDELEASL